MARMVIALMVGFVALAVWSLLSPVGLAQDLHSGKQVLLDGVQSPITDPQAQEAFPVLQETPNPYPAASKAIPLISLILVAAILVVFVVGVCLRYCLRRGR